MGFFILLLRTATLFEVLDSGSLILDTGNMSEQETAERTEGAKA